MLCIRTAGMLLPLRSAGLSCTLSWCPTKILRVMKLTALLMILFAVHVSATSKAQPITFNGQKVSITQVFRSVEEQTGLVFFYDADILRNAPLVTMKAENVPLARFLAELLKDQPLQFSIESKTITIFRKPEHKAPLPAILAMEIPVRGIIRDQHGRALPGTSVRIKGAKDGKMTDKDGYFYIDAAEGDFIIISFIGYTDKMLHIRNGQAYDVDFGKLEKGEVVTKEDGSLEIVLTTSLTDLKTIIINKGYYQENKLFSTSSVATVKAEDIARQNITNPLQALAGRTPGVYVSQWSGLPGGGINIQIRGKNSLRYDGNDPLYVIDGVPFTGKSLTGNNTGSEIIGAGSPLNNINPNDIERIDILKDADATAIYGSRGSNGVVLITLKKGQAGKNKLDINLNQGAGKVTNLMDLLNTRQYLDMRYEAFKNDGIDFTNPDYGATDLTQWDTTRYTDWQDVLVGGTANFTNLSATLSGGSERTQFMFGTTYFRQTAVYPGDYAFQRGSGSLSVQHKMLDNKLDLSVSVNYDLNRNTLPRSELMAEAIKLVPIAPAIYKADGSLNWENNTWQNPLSYTATKYTGKNSNFIAKMNLSYQPVKDLFIRLQGGYNDLQTTEVRLNPIKAQNPRWNPTGANYTGHNDVNTWIAEPQINYSFRLGNGRFETFVGSTFQQDVQVNDETLAFGFTSDALIENMAAAKDKSYRSGYRMYRYNSIRARLNYNLADKYILNITGNRDGSSRFGPGKQFANYGSVGATWIFSQEAFMQNHLPALSLGKLRASYGLTGSDAIADYGFIETYTTQYYSYNNVVGIYPTRLANSQYSWETNKKLNVALELGAWKDRVLLTAEWYYNRTGNQLVGLPLSVVTGQESIQFNQPAVVQNTGWEFLLNTANVQKRDFTWHSEFNISFPRNKLVSYKDFDKSPYANSRLIGQPITISRHYGYTGVDPQTGLHTVEDVNKDGKLSYPTDYAYFTNVTQDLFGGFNNEFRFKGLTLEIFFQFVKQRGYNSDIFFYNMPGTQWGNFPTYVMNRWQKPGDVSTVQRFGTGYINSTYDGYNIYRSSDQQYADASFIRLKTVSLSWNVPEEITGRLHMQQLRLYAQAQNLLTFTGYKGADPESNNASTLPPLKIATAGIQLTF